MILNARASVIFKKTPKPVRAVRIPPVLLGEKHRLSSFADSIVDSVTTVARVLSETNPGETSVANRVRRR